MTDIAITIDRHAGIHITTPVGAGQLAILGNDGRVITTPDLPERLRNALIDALIDDLTPAIRRVSRKLTPPRSGLG